MSSITPSNQVQDTDLCIAYPNKDAYSETFIRSHVEFLKPRCELFWGWYPSKTKEEASIHRFPLGLRVSRAVMKRLTPNWFHRQYTRQASAYLKKEQVRIVLAEYGPLACSLVDACDQAAIPLVAHFHGFDASHGVTLERYAIAYQRLFERGAAMVVVSKDMAGRLQRLGCPEEKIYVNPCGVDVEQFEQTRPAENPPIFLAVGRFVEKKGPDLTVQAFKLVAEQISEARLIMIGDGPLLKKCVNLSQSYDLEKSIKFCGSLPHDSVRHWLAKARAFVQHSHVAIDGDSEGTPVTILEASAAGLPIVSTRHAGINEAVIDGKTGFLVPEGDLEQMASHMISLARRPELAFVLGEAARTHVVRSYSSKRQNGRLHKLLFSRGGLTDDVHSMKSP